MNEDANEYMIIYDELKENKVRHYEGFASVTQLMKLIVMAQQENRVFTIR